MNINTNMTAKFIELHEKGNSVMVNLAHIVYIAHSLQNDRAEVMTTDCNFLTDESYEQISNTLSSYLDTAVVEIQNLKV